MDEKIFIRQLEAHQKELNRLIHRRLPVLIGRMAKDHFQNNFRLQGFLNNGLTRWPETRRQQSGGKSAASQYGPLLSGRNHLFASIKYSPADASVIIANDLLYAPLHNWGGSTHPAVTDKMRRFAWAMFYKEAGIKRAKSGKKRKRKWRLLPKIREQADGRRLHSPKRQNSISAYRSDSSSATAVNYRIRCNRKLQPKFITS